MVDFLVKLNTRWRVSDLNNISFAVTRAKANLIYDNPTLNEFLRSANSEISNEFMLSLYKIHLMVLQQTLATNVGGETHKELRKYLITGMINTLSCQKSMPLNIGTCIIESCPKYKAVFSPQSRGTLMLNEIRSVLHPL